MLRAILDIRLHILIIPVAGQLGSEFKQKENAIIIDV